MLELSFLVMGFHLLVAKFHDISFKYFYNISSTAAFLLNLPGSYLVFIDRLITQLIFNL